MNGNRASLRTMAALAAAALAALLACACGTPKTDLRSLQVLADTGANQGNATALDLVFVYDSASASLLPKNGPDWFANKVSLMAGLATAIDVVSLQVPPASTVSMPKNPHFPARYKKAIAVYSYPNYVVAAGQAQGNLTPYKSAQIHLTAGAVQYSDGSKSN